MGCTQSSAAANDGKGKGASSPVNPADVIVENLSATAADVKVEVPPAAAAAANDKAAAPGSAKIQEGRIERISETCTATFGGVSVRYAYLSQRGYYPDEEGKANQDSYSVTHNFANREGDAFFGVYDGHGPQGHKCSQFVRDNLPSMLAKGIRGDAEMTTEQLNRILERTHTACNNKIHRDKRVDDRYSGTTSISVYLRGSSNKITVSNVGDSRAIIGTMEEADESAVSSLVAMGLSVDQTPWRRDERKRIIDKGGRIMTEEQLNGKKPLGRDDFGDTPMWESKRGGLGEKVLGDEIDTSGHPPRVFSPHGDYPGLSLTRTIGDKVINDERVGVDAVPEMMTRELTPEDKIIVLASDGVWEFITNQEVIDMCAELKDPLKACQAIVAKSYDLWLENDTRTDDITMICIFLDEVKSGIESTSE